MRLLSERMNVTEQPTRDFATHVQVVCDFSSLEEDVGNVMDKKNQGSNPIETVAKNMRALREHADQWGSNENGSSFQGTYSHENPMSRMVTM